MSIDHVSEISKHRVFSLSLSLSRVVCICVCVCVVYVYVCRARWKSLDSISTASWCGSAVLGGWIADRYDYTLTFLVTAALQFVAGVMLFAPLLFIAPRFESEGEVDDSDFDSDSGRKAGAGEEVEDDMSSIGESPAPPPPSPDTESSETVNGSIHH